MTAAMTQPEAPSARIPVLLQELAAHPGVHGCALVEVETGMVWHCAGQWEAMESFAEAAVQVWRVQLRHREQFAVLGQPRSSICYFEEGSLALLPCAGVVPLLLVCRAERAGMNWASWMKGLQPLFHALARMQ